MMRPISALAASTLALLLTACTSSSSGPPPHEPLQLTLTIHAAETVNPDTQGRAAPIVVRLYELKTDGAFKGSDYFSLQDKDKTVLTDDLVKRDAFQLRPGASQTIQRDADTNATVLGVFAEYRDLPNAVWRAVYPLPATPEKAWYRASPKLDLTIDLGTDAIKITNNNAK